MKRDSILASVTGLFDSSTWAGKQGGAPRQLAAGRYAADAPRLQQNHVFSQSIPEHLHGAARPRGRGRAGNRRRPGGLSPPRRFSHLLRHGRRRGHAAVPRAASRRGSAGRESAGHGRAGRIARHPRRRPDPVIIVTALADDVDKLLGLRLGADDYVVKPFNPAEVVARLRAVLRRAGRMRTPRPSASAASRSTSRTTSRSRMWAAGAPCRCN